MNCLIPRKTNSGNSSQTLLEGQSFNDGMDKFQQKIGQHFSGFWHLTYPI